MRLIWLPFPYKAAISITDDTDNGTFIQFKTIYDLLLKLKFPTTRAMWVFEAEEPTGTPHLTLEFCGPLLSKDKECLEYCKMLHENGFEFCLHGASHGNNRRERTLEAINFLAKNIGESRVFICHSKNAENIYWENKCVENKLLSFIIKLYSKNKCYGEIEGSKYFWGDICKEKISYIRLFRTRNVNTLAFNPSMPYHIFTKPYVNYWFSATKGYIPKLFTSKNIDCLCNEHGASILYQYLHKYVDQDFKIRPEIIETLERLSDDKRLFIKPVSVVLDRLKSFQLLFLVELRNSIILVNASRHKVESIQISLDKAELKTIENKENIKIVDNILVIDSIPPLSFVKLFVSKPSHSNKYIKPLTFGNIVAIKFPYGSIVLNTSSVVTEIPNKCKKLLYPSSGITTSLNPLEVRVFYNNKTAEEMEILNPISNKELFSLSWGQASILLREHLLLGRKISPNSFSKNPGKVIEQANW